MPEEALPEIIASVGLYLRSRELTAAVMAERLGLEPSRTLDKGSILPPTDFDELDGPRIRTRNHMFILEVRRSYLTANSVTAPNVLEELLDELLMKIEPVAGKLEELRDSVSRGLQCFFASPANPGCFRLSREIFRRIAALELSASFHVGAIPKEEGQRSSEGGGKPQK